MEGLGSTTEVALKAPLYGPKSFWIRREQRGKVVCSLEGLKSFISPAHSTSNAVRQFFNFSINKVPEMHFDSFLVFSINKVPQMQFESFFFFFDK